MKTMTAVLAECWAAQWTATFRWSTTRVLRAHAVREWWR